MILVEEGKVDLLPVQRVLAALLVIDELDLGGQTANGALAAKERLLRLLRRAHVILGPITVLGAHILGHSH